MAAVAASRARASRWKGWNRRSTSAAGMTCPELVTDRTAQASLVAVPTWMSPPGMLCRTALWIKLATLRDKERVTVEDGWLDSG